MIFKLVTGTGAWVYPDLSPRLLRTKRNEPQWADYYWIDMVKLCQGFLDEGQEVEKVIYFTASPLNPEKSSRQSAFLNANKLINGDRFEVVRGKSQEHCVQLCTFIVNSCIGVILS